MGRIIMIIPYIMEKIPVMFETTNQVVTHHPPRDHRSVPPGGEHPGRGDPAPGPHRRGQMPEELQRCGIIGTSVRAG